MLLRLSAIAFICGLLTPAPGLTADLERGHALHETHCKMCHDSVAYRRDEKIAKTYEQVREQVKRWETNTGLRWTEQDIDNVASYISKTYYGIPCPSC
jgi:mono/diheme cytochrome c family protein